MPVALCVLGISRVRRAIHSSAKTPHNPNDHRKTSNSSQDAVTLGPREISAASPAPTTIDCTTMASEEAVNSRCSGASSIPGAFRYQWPKSIDANTRPSTAPEVATLSDDHQNACAVVPTVGFTVAAAAI